MSSRTGVAKTLLRHRILREIADSRGEVVLDCVNVKQAVWKPRRLNATGQFGNFSAGEARAVNDLLGGYASTPHWQGDMDVYRVIEINEAGAALLAEWDGEKRPTTEEST